MKLRYSSASPYARKVTIVAHECGLADNITLENANVWDPASDVVKDNPLGKVPALITDDGQALFDSPVICEYLDHLHDGPPLFPATGAAKWTALRRQALADGLLDAALLVRIETAMRPQPALWPAWIERQQAAILRCLDALEEEASDLVELASIGEISIAAALGYLDLRKAVADWRSGRPRLTAWFATVSQRPSMIATVPQG